MKKIPYYIIIGAQSGEKWGEVEKKWSESEADFSQSAPVLTMCTGRPIDLQKSTERRGSVMLTGEYRHAIDTKKRLFIPAKHRHIYFGRFRSCCGKRNNRRRLSCCFYHRRWCINRRYGIRSIE